MKYGLLNTKEVYSILVEYWDTLVYIFNILLYVLLNLKLAAEAAAAEVAHVYPSITITGRCQRAATFYATFFGNMSDIYSVTALYFDSTSLFIYLLLRHFPAEVNEVFRV